MHDSHPPSGHQTRPGPERKPVVGFVEGREVPVQHVLFGVGVVNQEQVSTAARECRANTRGVELTPRTRVPASGGLTVGGKGEIWEDLLVGLRVDDVPHLPTEIHSQIGGVGHQHDLLPGIPADKPCRIVGGHELTFAVAGRDVDAHPVFFPSLDSHQLVSQQSVVPSDLIIGVHPLAERDQVVFCSLETGTFVQFLEHALDFDDLGVVQGIDVLQESLKFTFVEANVTHWARLLRFRRPLRGFPPQE